MIWRQVCSRFPEMTQPMPLRLIDGSLEAFADRMNRRAAELGLSSTHFVTPSGLDAEGHETTALDLARLACAALQNEDFLALHPARL